MRGQSNAHHMAGARFLRDAMTLGGFALVDLGPYPGMVPALGGFVRGELYAVGAEIRDRLDAFEEHPHVYVRQRISIVGGLVAEAYLLRAEHARGHPRWLGGDWRRRR
jgi:gamma-glutamylcyclotransferase (GGCT)/AIG2-like uncharacterized protein YtfP